MDPERPEPKQIDKLELIDISLVTQDPLPGTYAKTVPQPRPRVKRPKGCQRDTYRETCPVCGHPEYCPTYGNR